jgi:Fe-S-cluster-containing hydrogenase component 2
VLALSSAFNSKGYHPPHVVHLEKCSGCDLCGMYCPDFAIYGTNVREVERAAAGRTKTLAVPHAGGGVHKPEEILNAIVEASRC